jgi:hypothetical protein
MSKKTIGPVTAFIIEKLDTDIQNLQTEIRDASASIDGTDSPQLLLAKAHLIDALNTELSSKIAEKSKRHKEQNRLIAQISNCLGKNGGVLGGAEYEACCPISGVCTCSDTQKIDVLVTFDTQSTRIVDANGHAILVLPFNSLCPNANFCQEDEVSNAGLRAFSFAKIFETVATSALPFSLIIDGVSYPMN